MTAAEILSALRSATPEERRQIAELFADMTREAMSPPPAACAPLRTAAPQATGPETPRRDDRWTC